MKKGLIITSISLIVVGLITFFVGIALNDFKVNETYEQKSESFESAKTIKIEVNTTDIIIAKSESDTIDVSYYESSKQKFTLSCENNFLNIKQEPYTPFFGLSLFSKNYNTKIYVPESFTGDIIIDGTTNDISVSSLTINSFKADISTGDIELIEINTSKVSIATTTGNIKCENVSATDFFDIDATTGDINLQNITSNSIDTSVTTGKITIKNATSEKINAVSDTGDVKFSSVEANIISIEGTTSDVKIDNIKTNHLLVETTTGDVTGKIIGSIIDYSITSSTTTGDNSLPGYMHGKENTINISTTTGDILISFTE